MARASAYFCAVSCSVLKHQLQNSGQDFDEELADLNNKNHRAQNHRLTAGPGDTTRTLRPRHPAAGAPPRAWSFVRRQMSPATARAARLKRRHQTE